MIRATRGVMPDFMLEDLVDDVGHKSQIQPASFEPFILEEAWEVKAYGNLNSGQRARNRIKKINNIKEEVLRVGKLYELQFAEMFDLPSNIFAKASPRSSIGRTGIYVQTMAEEGGKINYSPLGYCGEFYAYVQPLAFDVIIGDERLNQLRFSTLDAQLTEKEISANWATHPLLIDKHYDGMPIPIEQVKFHNNGFALTANVRPKLVYVPQIVNMPVRLEKNANEASNFWKYPEIIHGSFIASKTINILSSRNRIIVSSENCAELRSYDERYGEQRPQAAGFVDPGFVNNALTFEIIPKDVMWIRHGQELGILDYYKMIGPPEKPYSGSYVKSPRVQLAKWFKDSNWFKESTTKEQTLLSNYKV